MPASVPRSVLYVCMCMCVAGGGHVCTTSFTQLLHEKSHGQVVEMMIETAKEAAERVSAKVFKSK